MSAPQTGVAAPADTMPPAAAPAQSPGKLLRQARERAGLGVEDLAGQLKLAKGTIEALERDDFVTLSQPVYVRGYYRKIAKVLPVGEAELIGAYDAQVKPAPAPVLRRIPLASGVAAGTSRHSRRPGLGLAILVLLVLGVLFARVTREPAQRLAGAGLAPAAQAPAVPPPRAAPPHPHPVVSQDAATVVSPAQQPDPAPAATPAVTEPVATETVAAEPDATPPAVPPPAAVPNQLVLELSEASFVRVEDNRGRTLRIGLVHGGERHALDGQPPYTVFLGSARNVKVYFGGAPVDFSAHVNAQNDTARFTVP